MLYFLLVVLVSPTDDHIFSVLYNQGAHAAIAEVEALGVTPYDFGMNLAESNQLERANTWFRHMSQVSNDPSYVIGNIWVLRSAGDFSAATKQANNLSNSSDELTRARSKYILGLLYKDLGSERFAQSELREAQSIYNGLGKEGGVNLCTEALNSSNNKITSPPFAPPTDEGDA